MDAAGARDEARGGRIDGALLFGYFAKHPIHSVGAFLVHNPSLRSPTMQNLSSCACSKRPRLVFACSGAADVGAVAKAAAVCCNGDRP